MTRHLVAAVALAAAGLATPAVACTIDQCSFTQPVCRTRLVDCSDLNPIWGCTDTALGRSVCIPDPRDFPPPHSLPGR